MALSLGIVGLPNVGKSTLFNSLSKAKAQVANYPFCTIDPNVGVVEVPDERLLEYATAFKSKKIVPTVIEFLDIAGLVKGAATGEGLGNKFLANIRETDAIIEVVRCFEDPNIIHVDGKVDPARDIEVINLELILADLQVLEKRRDTRRNAAKNDPKLKIEVDLYSRLCEHLEKGLPARTYPFTDNEREIIKESQLLTTKPILYVTNVDETGSPEAVKVVKAIAAKEGAGVVAISAKLEAEVAELPPEEAAEFRLSLGIEFGLDQLIKESYKLLGLITYFTAGEPEARAWTIHKGDKAPQAAGKIHSDFEKGFIAADVIHYADFHRIHDYQKIKEAGLMRTEGKPYVVQDGDWMVFRFNV